MRGRLAAAGAAALLLVISGTAFAQDLTPPSTGTANPPPDPNAPLPPPGTAAPTSSGEGEKLGKDEKKDSGRGLEWLYLNADAGFSYINMSSLSDSNLSPGSLQSTSSVGPKFGVGAGIRLFILTLGVHANLNELSAFDLWQLDGELGFHIPIGHWEPYFGLHGGYCFVGSLGDGLSGSPSLSVTGGDAGLQLGLDYYFNHFVSVGIEADGSAFFLHRAPTAIPAAAAAELPPQAAMLYQQSGDSVGLGVVGSVHLGFHL